MWSHPTLGSPARWADKLSELWEISSWETSSSLAGMRASLFLPSSRRHLETSQFLGVSTASVSGGQWAGHMVSAASLHSCQDGHTLAFTSLSQAKGIQITSVKEHHVRLAPLSSRPQLGFFRVTRTLHFQTLGSLLERMAGRYVCSRRVGWPSQWDLDDLGSLGRRRTTIRQAKM